jgi:hypothetical protein
MRRMKNELQVAAAEVNNNFPSNKNFLLQMVAAAEVNNNFLMQMSLQVAAAEVNNNFPCK